MKWPLPLLLSLFLSLLLPAFAAAAATPPPEYELDVSGTLEIGPDGSVRSYELKPAPSAAVAALVEKAVAHSGDSNRYSNRLC